MVAFLAPYGITANRAVKLFEIYGRQTLNIVQNHPYRLCEVAGISFHTADKIAMSMGYPAALRSVWIRRCCSPCLTQRARVISVWKSTTSSQPACKFWRPRS